jgi:quercetin dioxygenase-like cupin family protein
MWMKAGSFWTQPQGESHITSAKGEENIALVEIDKGPYLVKSSEVSFDNGERPINIDVSNIVWLNSKKTNWIDSNSIAEISLLWEGNNAKGLFVKLPKTFKGAIKTDGTVLHSVVIQGELKYTLPQNQESKMLDTGSYFGATSKAVHIVSNNSEDDIILYMRTNGNIRVE